MKRYVVLEKRIGETPLMALREWKSQHPAYAPVAASYAGRLDPMASGRLLVLLGEECKRQRAYTGLDKEYEIEVLLDVGSDTGDVLGISCSAEKETQVSRSELARVLSRELGAHTRAYPRFSSKTVHGKPLFLHTLEGTLPDEDIPVHTERIFRIRELGVSALPKQELQKRIEEMLALVPRTSEPSKKLGEDFRIDAVRAAWETLFAKDPERNFLVLRLRVTCASGAYMRSLAARIGENLGTKALVLSINRTKIGKYLPLWKGTGVWLRTF